MLVKIAWRNVWRNKSRSFVVISAIAIGILAANFFAAFMTGMVNQQVKKAIYVESSHLQIHHADFTFNEDVNLYLEDATKIVDELKSNPQVKSVAARQVSNGMASTASKASGVRILGVDPQQELNTTEIHSRLDTGSYFEAKWKTPQILIGRKLAEELKVRLKSKIVLNMPDLNGNVSYGLFRVAGIFHTGNGLFDGATVFVKQSDLQPLIATPQNAAHEIAILLNQTGEERDVQKELQNKFPDKSIQTWGELQPTVKTYSEFIGNFNFILLFIILAALIFGIINTMLMVILERTHEIGMLRSVGMTKLRVMGMIVLETVFLATTGGLLGCVLSIGIVGWLGSTGLDLTPYMGAMEEMGWSPIIHPQVEPIFYVQITVSVIFTAIIASYFPARRAIKLNPATAIREV